MIVFAGKQRFRFEIGDVGVCRSELFVEILQQVVFLGDVGFFLRQVNVGFDVAGKRIQLFVGGNLFFRALAVAQDGLRGFGIVPEIGVGSADFQSLQALTILRRVKDNSERE